MRTITSVFNRADSGSIPEIDLIPENWTV